MPKITSRRQTQSNSCRYSMARMPWQSHCTRIPLIADIRWATSMRAGVQSMAVTSNPFCAIAAVDEPLPHVRSRILAGGLASSRVKADSAYATAAGHLSAE
jgi:hypothetical protein